MLPDELDKEEAKLRENDLQFLADPSKPWRMKAE